MIDTKELRQLVQDATPGPWYVRSSNYDVRNIYSANAITDSEGFTFQPVIATVEDIAPAVSLCADIDAAIARATGEQP